MKHRRSTNDWLRARSDAIEEEEAERFFSFIFFLGFSGLHLLFVLTIVFDSLIPTILMFCIYVFSVIGLRLALKRRQVKYYGWKSYFFAPTAIHLLLALNYFISWPIDNETYQFQASIEQVPNRTNSIHATGLGNQVTTGIILEDNAYQNYIGIRVFSSMDKFRGMDKVTYHFNRGILGIRIVKDYEFHR